VRVRDDFDAGVFVTAAEHRWVPAPEPGVERMMLERIGDEDAVATSFVRFAPGARFPSHVHTLGEEFLVLEGDFRDAAGCYRACRYVRHPPSSAHAPWSEDGCLLFVKLKQFAPDDAALVDRDLAASPERAGARVTRNELHRFRDERVELVEAGAGAQLELPSADGLTELLVLDGLANVNDRALDRLGWARLPRGSAATLRFERASRIWLKVRGAEVDRAIAAQGRMNA